MSDETSKNRFIRINPDLLSIEADESGLQRLAAATNTALEDGNSQIDIDESDVKYVSRIGERAEATENRIPIYKKAVLLVFQAFFFIWFFVLPFVSIVLIVKIYSSDKYDMRTDCATLYIQGLLKQYGY